MRTLITHALQMRAMYVNGVLTSNNERLVLDNGMLMSKNLLPAFNNAM